MTTDRCSVSTDTSSEPTGGGASARWSILANAGSLITAFLASACCIGPLVFALLGLSGAGFLLKFEPYRPYFMGVTLALLGAGFYFTYRKPVEVSGAACNCKTPRTNRIGKIMLWATTVLVLGFLVFPYVAPMIWG